MLSLRSSVLAWYCSGHFWGKIEQLLESRRHHQGMPARAAGARRVRERVRQVRRRHVLLPGPVRAQLPADKLLEVLQGQVPGRLQLRQGRPDQHLHLPTWNQLPDRPLPRPK